MNSRTCRYHAVIVNVFAQIRNLNGSSAIIVVSCVSKDPPYFPHPHNLVGSNCKDGVCTMRLKPQQNTVKYVAAMNVVSQYLEVITTFNRQDLSVIINLLPLNCLC